jgi:hypothetical protein
MKEVELRGERHLARMGRREIHIESFGRET